VRARTGAVRNAIRGASLRTPPVGGCHPEISRRSLKTMWRGTGKNSSRSQGTTQRAGMLTSSATDAAPA